MEKISKLAAISFLSAVTLSQDVQALDWFKQKPPASASMGILQGNKNVGGGFSDLLHQGKPIGNKLDGKYMLVYFGTSYRLPNCSVDLLLLQEVSREIERKCGSGVATVFISPEHNKSLHPAPDNLTQYVDAKGSKIIGLVGSQIRVMDVASGYKARYFLNGGGVPNNHTRFTYLMEKGQNLAIIPADLPLPIIVDHVLRTIKEDTRLSCDLK